MKKIANSPEKYSIVNKNGTIYVIVQYTVAGFAKSVPFIIYKYDTDNESLIQICTWYFPDSLRNYRPLLYKAMTLVCWLVASDSVKLSPNSVWTPTAKEIDRLVKLYQSAYTNAQADNYNSFFPL